MTTPEQKISEGYRQLAVAVIGDAVTCVRCLPRLTERMAAARKDVAEAERACREDNSTANQRILNLARARQSYVHGELAESRAAVRWFRSEHSSLETFAGILGHRPSYYRRMVEQMRAAK
jgi:outer membrane murein-binding lipoprotein Lpp